MRRPITHPYESGKYNLRPTNDDDSVSGELPASLVTGLFLQCSATVQRRAVQPQTGITSTLLKAWTVWWVKEATNGENELCVLRNCGSYQWLEEKMTPSVQVRLNMNYWQQSLSIRDRHFETEAMAIILTQTVKLLENSRLSTRDQLQHDFKQFEHLSKIVAIFHTWL
jgi:hypothetical protein